MRHKTAIFVLAISVLGLTASMYAIKLSQQYRQEAAEQLQVPSSQNQNPAAIPFKVGTVAISDVTGQQATVRWTTTKPGWATLYVGIDPQNLQPVPDPSPDLGLEGQSVLTQLKPNQRYHVRVQVLSPAGQETTSDTVDFITRP